jgi:outer membrane protein assembly factor BamB
MRGGKLLLLAAAWLGAGAAPVGADDWLRFRGPGGLGLTRDMDLPLTWSADNNLVWKTALPGPGASSPIVVGNKVFVTCYSGYGVDKENPGDLKNLKRHLLCVDRANGKVLWAREVPAAQFESRWQTYLNLHGYASSTPVSDGKTVFVFFGRTGVLAYDLAGKKLWHTVVGTGTHNWGSAASPILYKNLVIVNASEESHSLIALDKKTGEKVWQAEGMKDSWSTPILVQTPAGGTELVLSASKKIWGLDPQTGKELWHADSFNWYVCPSVVAHEGIVYALQNTTCVAVRAGGRGDVTKTHTLWQKRFGATVPSPIYHDGYLYWATNVAFCLNAKDGTKIYSERLKGGDNAYASGVLGDGKIYYVTRTGGTFVVQAGPKFKLLAHNTLEPDTSVFNGSPAVSDSQLFLRSDRYLYCIGKRR